jgi:hypothetical protein
MGYTDHSDVYGALHEEGINRVVTHLQHKRPSLFNYGTARVVAGAYAAAEIPPPKHVDVRTGRLPPCEEVPHAPEVRDRRWNNPLMTEEDPFPVLGTDGLVGMDYAVQVTDLGIDFAPPTEESSFKDQQYAANASVCAGLGCPGDSELDEALEAIEQFRSYVERREDLGMATAIDDEALLAEFGLPAVPRADQLRCFCLDVEVVGSVRMVDRPTVEGPLTIPHSPKFAIDDIRLTDLEGETEFPLPAGFVHSLECYIEVFLRLGVFPSLAETVERTVQQALAMQNPVLTLGGLTATVELPTSEAVPFNPAIEEDELRVYVDLDVAATGGAS